MATTTAERELYPLSTTDSKAIPFDVVYPLSCVKWEFAVDAATPIVIPASMDIVYVFSSADVLIDYGNTLTYPAANDTEFTQGFIIPSDTLMSIRLPDTGNARIIPLRPNQPGIVYMQAVQKWAALGLKRQLGTR